MISKSKNVSPPEAKATDKKNDDIFLISPEIGFNSSCKLSP